MITGRFIDKRLDGGRIVVLAQLTEGESGRTWTEPIVIENAVSANEAESFLVRTLRLLIDQKTAVLASWDAIEVDPTTDVDVSAPPVTDAERARDALAIRFSQFRFLLTIFPPDHPEVAKLRPEIERAVLDGRIDFLGVHVFPHP